MSVGEEVFDAAVTQIEERRERAQSGHANCIPFPFSRTAHFFPGIERGTYDIVTANSGIGKSKFARYLYVMHAYMFIKENPDADIRLKIFYFSLEESREKFMMSLISYYLDHKHKVRVSVKQLRSVGKLGYTLPEDTLELIKEAREWFKDLEKIVTVIDDVKNPTGIFKVLKTHHEQNGNWSNRTYIDTSSGEERTVPDKYTPNDPNEYVMCITDHIGLLHTEKGMNKWETISKFSAQYCVELRNKYGCIVVNVQQQAADKEKKQFNYRGTAIAEKLEPSLDGLGTNKTTQQDADNVFGIFAPDRYQLPDCEGYNIGLMQDHFRLMIILKSRDGDENVRTPLFFDGACSNFVEMPRAENTGELSQVYEHVRTLYNV